MAIGAPRSSAPARALLAALLALSAYCAQGNELDELAAQSRERWERSAQGERLARILPPGVEASRLPEPQSAGAKLTARYCVQCHHLPSPHMHSAARWRPIVDRMIWRMRGHGNSGVLMKEMMAGVAAPDERQAGVLADYLRRHGQHEIEAARYPDLRSPEGRAFQQACSQCHALPDPRRHARDAWPGVVQRMQRHMSYLNVVVSPRPDAREPRILAADVLRFLQRHARTD